MERKVFNTNELYGISWSANNHCGYECEVTGGYDKVNHVVKTSYGSAEGVLGSRQKLFFDSEENALKYWNDVRSTRPGYAGSRPITRNRGTNDFFAFPILLSTGEKIKAWTNIRKLGYMNPNVRQAMEYDDRHGLWFKKGFFANESLNEDWSGEASRVLICLEYKDWYRARTVSQNRIEAMFNAIQDTRKYIGRALAVYFYYKFIYRENKDEWLRTKLADKVSPEIINEIIHLPIRDVRRWVFDSTVGREFDAKIAEQPVRKGFFANESLNENSDTENNGYLMIWTDEHASDYHAEWVIVPKDLSLNQFKQFLIDNGYHIYTREEEPGWFEGETSFECTIELLSAARWWGFSSLEGCYNWFKNNNINHFRNCCIDTSLDKEVLEETYSDEELDDLIGKVYNQQRILNIYRRQKYGDKRLYAHTRCTECGREKKVYLSNLLNDPDKYGSCVCSDTNIESKIDRATDLYDGSMTLRNNTSGHTGVSFIKTYRGEAYNKWRAYIDQDGKRTYLGDFSEKRDAIKAREEAAKKGVRWYKLNKSKIKRNTRGKYKRTRKLRGNAKKRK